MTALLIIYGFLVIALTAAEYRRSLPWQKLLKPLAALGFIAVAILSGALYWQYGLLVLSGLIACALGDVLLLPRGKPWFFKLGMAAFAIGHILYLVAFFTVMQGSWLNPVAILPVILGGLFFWWIRPKLPKDMVIPVAVYSFIIIVMVIMSLKVSPLIVPIAAALFAISDMFVARDRFVVEEPRNALIITPLYFGSQALFALSASIGI